MILTNRYTGGDYMLREALEDCIKTCLLPAYRDYLLEDESSLNDLTSFFKDHLSDELVERLEVNDEQAWSEILESLTYYNIDGNYLITIRRDEYYEGTDLPLYMISRAINYGTSKIASSGRLSKATQRLEEDIEPIWRDYLWRSGYYG